MVKSFEERGWKCEKIWESEPEKEQVGLKTSEKRRLDQANTKRIREITNKAVSAILVVLLK